MPSAFIPSVLGYPAMHLAVQQIHQRYVHPGPLVLRTALLKFPPPVIDRDRTVSRRSEPSSRTALMGEQPNPFGGDRPSQTVRLTVSPARFHGRRLEPSYFKSGIPTATPARLAPCSLSLPPILYMKYKNSISSYSKAPWGLSV